LTEMFARARRIGNCGSNSPADKPFQFGMEWISQSYGLETFPNAPSGWETLCFLCCIIGKSREIDGRLVASAVGFTHKRVISAKSC
jgi:hypothetical protein